MNLLPIILYIAGIVGIIISLLLIVFSIKKGSKSSLTLVAIIFLLAIFLMSAGAGITFLKSTQNQISESQIEISSESTKSIEEEQLNVKEASIEDLKFYYKFVSLKGSSDKNVCITIDNKSDSVFNGQIKLNFTDSSNEITDTIVLPIKNFMPSSCYKPTALVSSNALNVDYSFSGTFDENADINIPFTINKITVGNNFFRFDVSTDDISQQNLKSICDNFASEYDSSMCNGFLIYFYPSGQSDNINFNDAIGDFYLDNLTNKSKLIVY